MFPTKKSQLIKDIKKFSKNEISSYSAKRNFDNGLPHKNVSKLSDAVICGSSIVNKIAEGHKKKLKGKNLATFVGKYVKKLSKGLSKT